MENKQTPPLSNEEYSKRVDYIKTQMFAAMKKLQTTSYTKNENITYTAFDKNKYRNYMKNPRNNEDNLREMSRFFYRISNPYKRLIKYFSDIPLFYWNIMPVFDYNNPPDTNKLLKQYIKQLKMLNNMNMSFEFRKILNNVMIDGIFYGFIYSDKNSFFIHKLEPKYCKIVEIEYGCFNFAFNFAYFDTYTEQLEYWDPIFKTMYDAYKKDTTNLQWQLLDSKRTICIKFDKENLRETLPPMGGIFEPLIDLIDARTLQRVKDEIQNYKLIIQKIPFFENTEEEDAFKLQVDTAIEYYQRLCQCVPEAVGVALSPMETDTVDFKTDDDSDDLISTSMKTVFDDSGTSQMLFNSEKSGSLGLDASIKTDVAYIWSVVESLQTWVNRYILFNTTSIRFNFEFLRVDIFNKDGAVDRELKLANSGVPNKIKLAATSGINPYEMLSAQYFENEVLDIAENWVPLQTSYTLSNRYRTRSLSGGSSRINDDVDSGVGGTEGINDNTEINKDANGNVDTIEG